MNTSRPLSFEKLHNIRDLGGMTAYDGQSIISGRLIRCAQLSELSDSDRSTLVSLADTVVDFRTDGERSETKKFSRCISSHVSYEKFLLLICQMRQSANIMRLPVYVV